MGAGASTVIVLIDDDAALLELLVQLLSGPGRNIETVRGGNGLSLDLLTLSRPGLVILNPNSNGLTFERSREFIDGLRKATGASIVLMIEGNDAQGAARRLGADSGVELKVLLRDPLAQLRLDQNGPAPVAPLPAGPVLKGMSDLQADDILALDFSASYEPPRVGPVLPSTPERVRESPVAVDLAMLIDEELANHRAPDTSANLFSVTLDTVGDDALFAESDGTASGIFVATTLSAKIGDTAHVDVSFPWGQKASWQGIVSWVSSHASFGRRRKAGIGITLSGLTETDGKAMARLSSLRAPMRVPSGATKG